MTTKCVATPTGIAMLEETDDVGFTGPASGMTGVQQMAVIRRLLKRLKRDPRPRLHHGDCIGGDAEFHAIGLIYGLEMVVHPPYDPKKRAFCNGGTSEIREPKPYLERDRDIVDETALLIGAVSNTGYHHKNCRDGYCYTIRYALKAGKEVVVVETDGTTRRLP